MLLRIADDLGGCIEAHGIGIQQRRAEHVGVMMLHPARGLGDLGEAGSVTFGETREPATVLDLEMLRTWGLIEVPGHLWRAMSRYGPWIEPMLVAECARLTRAYADRMGLAVAPGYRGGRTGLGRADPYDYSWP